MRWNRNCRDLNLVVLAGLFFLAAVFAPIKQRSLECIGPQKLSDRILLLDAGHGGEDGGAVSVTGKPESGINLAIVLRLDALCGFFGVNTILTRQDDTSLKDKNSKTLAQMKRTDLNNRVKLVNSQQNAVLISRIFSLDPITPAHRYFLHRQREVNCLQCIVSRSWSRNWIHPIIDRQKRFHQIST